MTELQRQRIRALVTSEGPNTRPLMLAIVLLAALELVELAFLLK